MAKAKRSALTEPKARPHDGNIQRIPRSKIRRFADQPRTFFDPQELAELQASIEEVGQQTPIVVRAIASDPEHDFELVDGERRLIACGQAGVETMLAWVRPIADAEEQFTASVVGNFGRSSHTPLEIAAAIERIRKSPTMARLSPGDQVARIAKIFGRSAPWVYQHQALLRLDPEVQALMSPTRPEEHRLGTALAIFISSLHSELQSQIAKTVVGKMLNLNQARAYARRVADEAGLEAGSATRKRRPSDDFRNLKTFVRRTKEASDTFFEPVVQRTLYRKSLGERKVMALELKQCAFRLHALAKSLTEDQPESLPKEA